jgi:hypothetical protein
MDSNELVAKYLISLSDKEKKALSIAKSHLGNSYQTVKSIGFIKWMKENSK